MGLGTAVMVAERVECDDEMTVSVRAFELGFFMGQNKAYTVKRAAKEFALSPSGAYRLLERVCASRRVPVVCMDGEYSVAEGLDAQDWPY